MFNHQRQYGIPPKSDFICIFRNISACFYDEVCGDEKTLLGLFLGKLRDSSRL